MARLDLEEIALVQHLAQHFAHVIGLVGIVGDQRVEAVLHPVPGIADGAFGHGFPVRQGQEIEEIRAAISASISLSSARSATLVRVVWVIAPPSSSCVTTSLVTVFTTSGPVTNMYELSFTMKMKSVIAGL
jgi:hypothetical protein